MALTFMDDPRGLRQRYDIGVESIMWSSDYPHPATTWPHSRESIGHQFQGVPEGERKLMTCGKAARSFKSAPIDLVKSIKTLGKNLSLSPLLYLTRG